MFATLTQELLDLQLSEKGADVALCDTFLACCCTCCSIKVM